MTQAVSLCRDFEVFRFSKLNKNQLCYYKRTELVLLARIPQYCAAGIPSGNFPSIHACRAAWRLKQARNRTAGNTLLLRIASNLYIKMAAPGLSFSRNTGIKIHCRRACLTEKPGLPVSCDLMDKGKLI